MPISGRLALMPEAPPRALPGQLAQRVLLDASNDGEALVSGVRIVFLGLVLARYLALGGVHAEGGVPAAWVELPVLGIGILLSVASVGAARRRWFDERLLVASTLLDAVLAHASLLSTLAWHGPQYTGLLRMPDPAAAIAVVFASALRLCPRAAWVGTVTNLALVGGLVALDFRLNAAFITYGLSEVVLLFLFIASVGAVASLVCHTARRMVLTMAGTRERAQRTRRHLDLLLREHHDARTLLSSARLRADLLVRQPEGRATERHARAIAEDLGELAAFVSRVKSRAMGELAMSGDASAVDVGTTLHQAAEQVQLRFTHVHIVVEGDMSRRGTSGASSAAFVRNFSAEMNYRRKVRYVSDPEELDKLSRMSRHFFDPSGLAYDQFDAPKIPNWSVFSIQESRARGIISDGHPESGPPPEIGRAHV